MGALSTHYFCLAGTLHGQTMMKRILRAMPASRSTYIWARALAAETAQPVASNRVEVQFLRSLAVSVVALIVDFGVLIFAKEVLGVHYLLAAGLGFTLGVVINYILSVIWVFATRKITSRRHEFAIFIIVCLVGLGLNTVIIAGFVEALMVDYRVAKAISTVVVFFWNFMMRKKLLY